MSDGDKEEKEKEKTVQLTPDDCRRILKYLEWLESKTEVCGYTIGEEFSKAENSIQKLIEGM